MHDNKEILGSLSVIVGECKNIIRTIPGTRLLHVYREANTCVGRLANIALSYPLGEHLMPEELHDMRQLLFKDSMCVSWPWSIPM